MSTVRAMLVAIAFAATTCATQSAMACPMCKIAHEDSEDPGVKARPKAYMYSILFMLSMPASLTTAFGVTLYRLLRKQSALNEAAGLGQDLGDSPDQS